MTNAQTRARWHVFLRASPDRRGSPIHRMRADAAGHNSLRVPRVRGPAFGAHSDKKAIRRTRAHSGLPAKRRRGCPRGRFAVSPAYLGASSAQEEAAGAASPLACAGHTVIARASSRRKLLCDGTDYCVGGISLRTCSARDNLRPLHTARAATHGCWLDGRHGPIHSLQYARFTRRIKGGGECGRTSAQCPSPPT